MSRLVSLEIVGRVERDLQTHPGSTVQDLAMRLGISDGSVRQALRELRQQRMVSRQEEIIQVPRPATSFSRPGTNKVRIARWYTTDFGAPAGVKKEGQTTPLDGCREGG